jgi:hypothetical protein
MTHHADYPDAEDPKQVGEHSVVAKAGGGLVWDEVLEYRVWCHPACGVLDSEDGGVVTLAGKPGDDLAPGTLNSMLKRAGLKQKE